MQTESLAKELLYEDSMATISFDVNSLNLVENQEQRAASDRIKLEDTIPIKGPPGT